MDDLSLIKQKINVVDLVSEYLPLKKAGVNFKANCPFHNERTPSFVVSPERQIWHCFGCDRGGDIFKFVMEKEGLTFPESLEILAQKAGVVLQKTGKKKDSNEQIYLVNQKAQQFFQHILLKHPLGKKPLGYLQKRGLKAETIEQFGIGYAPQNWESLTNFLKKRGFGIQDLIISGLCVPSKGSCYDRFRGRITFPLIDIRGRIVGFSGRIIDHGEPKYINTPQTPVFDKGKFIFGLHISKPDIRKSKEAILVEGEMDMLFSYQVGVKNVVASKGTALTEQQIESLKKQADAISLCFDTDLAGDSASRRGIEIADKAGLNIKVIKIEGAKDPAELCLKNPQQWLQNVLKAEPIYDYYLQSANQRYGIKSASSKKAISAELMPIFRKISDPIVKEHYTQKLAALLQIKDDVIKEEMDKLKPEFKVLREDQTQVRKVEPYSRRELLEAYLIALMLHIPLQHTFVPSFPETLFLSEELRQIYVLLVLFLDSISFKAKSFKISEFIKKVPESLVAEVDKLYLMPIDDKLTDLENWQKELNLVVTQLKKTLIKTSLEKLSLQIKSAQEFDNMEQLGILNKRFRDLSIKLKNL